MTHEYVIAVGGRIRVGRDAGHEPEAATSIAWAADRVLAVGPDDLVRAISRGDSVFLDLGGCVVTAAPGADIGDIEPGSVADLDFWDGPRVVARVRAGRFTEGDEHSGPFPRATTAARNDMASFASMTAGTGPTDRIATFRQLHESGCFVIPNPWDAGSATYLAMLGFQALATTSSGFAWSLGKSDRTVTLDEALGHFRAIAAAVDVPVNADFEGGFAVEPSGVAANVRLAAATGVAGISIEDSTGDPAAPLFDFDLAVERIRAARGAIDASGTGVLLTGRSEGFIEGRPDLAETIRRLTAYAEAGADCLYAPGIRSMAEITAVVEAVAPKPVNVLVGSDFTTVAELAAAGVRRISLGGVLARVAWTGFIAAATEIAERGTFTGLAGVVPFDDLDGRFVGD